MTLYGRRGNFACPWCIIGHRGYGYRGSTTLRRWWLKSYWWWIRYVDPGSMWSCAALGAYGWSPRNWSSVATGWRWKLMLPTIYKCISKRIDIKSCISLPWVWWHRGDKLSYSILVTPLSCPLTPPSLSTTLVNKIDIYIKKYNTLN